MVSFRLCEYVFPVQKKSFVKYLTGAVFFNLSVILLCFNNKMFSIFSKIESNNFSFYISTIILIFLKFYRTFKISVLMSNIQ